MMSTICTYNIFLKLKIIILLIAVLTSIDFSQDTGRIEGYVTDSLENTPIAYANVIVEGTSKGASTDVNGFYFINNVKPGIYSLKCSCIGYYQSRKENIRVNRDSTTTCSFLINEIYLSRYAALKDLNNGEIIIYLFGGIKNYKAVEDYAKKWRIEIYVAGMIDYSRYNDEVYMYLDNKYGDGWCEQFLLKIFEIGNADPTFNSD